jgi:hypothetical protein
MRTHDRERLHAQELRLYDVGTEEPVCRLSYSGPAESVSQMAWCGLGGRGVLNGRWGPVGVSCLCAGLLLRCWGAPAQHSVAARRGHATPCGATRVRARAPRSRWQPWSLTWQPWSLTW